VEAMAPEHVFHALVEVFKRKKPRDGEDLQVKLRRRMGMAFMDSGLSRDAYLEVVQVRDEATQTLLDAALDEVAEQDAKAEAVQRAFAGSGAASIEAFADMYGMNPHAVQRQLHRAKQLQGQQAE
jgi:ProP effector